MVKGKDGVIGAAVGKHRFFAEGIDIKIGIKPSDANFAAILLGNLAGAEGFEPSPSSLTVRCPTGWTTPQRVCKNCSETEADSASPQNAAEA